MSQVVCIPELEYSTWYKYLVPGATIVQYLVSRFLAAKSSVQMAALSVSFGIFASGFPI